MRLSDAIALGRATVAQMKAADFSAGPLGMAANACGINDKYSGLEARWPWLRNSELECPISSGRFWCRKQIALAAIYHVFDEHVMYLHDWTLDQLIDWIRSVEPQEAEASLIPKETVDEAGTI